MSTAQRLEHLIADQIHPRIRRFECKCLLNENIISVIVVNLVFCIRCNPRFTCVFTLQKEGFTVFETHHP